LVFATGLNEYKLTHKGFELAMKLLQADQTGTDLCESQSTNADIYSPIEMSSKIYSREELSQIDEEELLNTPLFDLIFSPKKKESNSQVFEIDDDDDDDGPIVKEEKPKMEKKPIEIVDVVDTSINSENEDDVICIE
jgi:hypothetical protein